MASHGVAWHGGAFARRCMAGQGTAGPGAAWQSWAGPGKEAHYAGSARTANYLALPPSLKGKHSVKLRLDGVTPLMMHNVRLADPDEPIVRQISDLTAKKSAMTDAERLEVARLKFLGGMYYDQQSGPYLPAANIFASLIAAARKTRKGLD